MTNPCETQLEMLADPEAMSRRVADWMLEAATTTDGDFTVALSGGSTPRRLYHLLAGPGSDRISVGFPGLVREGRTLTAPHFGRRLWHDFPLAAALSKRLGKPVRLLNDAEIQGLGIVGGDWRSC